MEPTTIAALAKLGIAIAPHLLGSDTTTTSENISSLSPEMEAMLAKLTGTQADVGKFFDPAKAGAESQNAFDMAIRQTMEQFMPQLASEAAGSGLVGGGTTGGMLQGDLAVRAAQAGTAARTDVVTRYGDLALKAAQAATASAAQTTKTTKQTTREKKEPAIDLKKFGKWLGI